MDSKTSVFCKSYFKKYFFKWKNKYEYKLLVCGLLHIILLLLSWTHQWVHSCCKVSHLPEVTGSCLCYRLIASSSVHTHTPDKCHQRKDTSLVWRHFNECIAACRTFQESVNWQDTRGFSSAVHCIFPGVSLAHTLTLGQPDGLEELCFMHTPLQPYKLSHIQKMTQGILQKHFFMTLKCKFNG